MLFPIKVSPYDTSITAPCSIYFSLEELTVFPWWTPKQTSFHSDYRRSSGARNNTAQWKTSPLLTLTRTHPSRAGGLTRTGDGCSQRQRSTA